MISWFNCLFRRKTSNGVSIKLALFLEEYLVWAKKIAPRQSKYDNLFVFVTTEGLCGNLLRWCNSKDIPYSKHHKLGKELHKLFLKEELCRMYPFGHRNYWRQSDKGSLHEDPIRISFCEKYSKND